MHVGSTSSQLAYPGPQPSGWIALHVRYWVHNLPIGLPYPTTSWLEYPGPQPPGWIALVYSLTAQSSSLNPNITSRHIIDNKNIQQTYNYTDRNQR